MNTCCLNNCTFKAKYDKYCWRHRKNHLIKSDDTIICDHYTGSIKDYTIKQLQKTYKNMSGDKKTHNKDFYFEYIDRDFRILQKYNNNDVKIIQKLQTRIKNKKLLDIHGPCLFNRTQCNNNEDFFTFEELKEINMNYFFSYKDINNIYWGFDIRSLKELLDKDNKNPYTRIEFPNETIDKIKYLITKIEDGETHSEQIQQLVISRKQQIKMNITDVFSQIEYVGYSCNQEWLINLTPLQIKKLYKNLEDIWNYRANPPPHIKKKIAPNDGILFSYPIQDYFSIVDKYELFDILTNDLLKIKRSSDLSDQKTGFMYFIIGLSYFSVECFNTHPWILHATM